MIQKIQYMKNRLHNMLLYSRYLKPLFKYQDSLISDTSLFKYQIPLICEGKMRRVLKSNIFYGNSLGVFQQEEKRRTTVEYLLYGCCSCMHKRHR